MSSSKWSKASAMVKRQIDAKKRQSKRNSQLSRFRSGNLHNFHRSEWKSNQTITCDATGFAGLGFEFRLDQISDYLNFQPLFDTFRISAVSLEIIPLNNTYPLPNVQPQIAMAVDFDSSDAPVAMEKLLCRKRAKLRPFNRRVTKYLKPKVSSAVYSAGVSTDYAQKSQPVWLDLPDGTNVPCYGAKVAFQASPLQEIVYHQRIKYYLQFKEPIVR